MRLRKKNVLLNGRNTHQNRDARLGRPANKQKKRDDETDSDANLDTPDDCKEEGESHERHVNPCSHPVIPIVK